MRIWASVDGVEKEAYKIDGSFNCFPSSTNTKADARLFASIEEAAVFLITNPTWGIRMAPGSAIIYRGIQISR